MILARLRSRAGLALGALILGLALAAFAPVAAAPSFPPLTGRVVDAAAILPPPVEAQLTERLAQLESQSHRQLVVVTVASLQGLDIADYGYQLGRQWGIGQKGGLKPGAEHDNGVLLIVAPNERKVRIEVGYGLEPVLTDALSSVILQTQVLPRFKAGDMSGGVVAGTDAIIRQLALPEDQARAAAQQASQGAAQQGGDGGGWGLLPILFVLFVLFSLMRGGRRGRRGGGGWMVPIILGGLSRGGWSDRGGFGSGGGGGFRGGGGSFGGGGASGGW
jgi:uncharacterized protein